MKKIFIFIGTLILISSSLSGISIRGNTLHLITAGPDHGEELSFNLNDLVAISMTDSSFIEGLELNITLPAAFIRFRDSFALTLYKDTDPKINSSVTNYRGKKIFFNVLPIAKKMYIDIPVRTLFSRTSSPQTYVIKKLIPGKQFPLILKIEPVMKGIPSSLLSEHFKLKITTILTQKGSVSLRINPGKHPESYVVRIDNNPVAIQKGEILLTPGIHQLKVSSDFYEEYTSNFAVKAGHTTAMDITLHPYQPTVQFDFPQGALLYLDGKKMTVSPDKKQAITPGEHVVRITIGDYTLSKKFTVLKEKSYKLSLFLDIFVKEN